MRQSSARVLLVVSVILAPMGVVMISPEAGLFFIFLVGIFASIAMFLGMKRVRQIASRVLLVVSVIFVPMGVVIISPEAGLFLMFLVGIFSSIAAYLGTKRVRYTAWVLLAVAASIAVWRYPEAKRLVQHVPEASAVSQEEPASE